MTPTATPKTVVTSHADPQAVARLVDAGLDPLLARLLVVRGVTEPLAARKFLNPPLADLPDPDAMADMPVAVRLIADALAAKTPICVYGDYDADGISAAALLHDLFAKLQHPVRVFLPDRFRDGYGLHHERLQELCDDGMQLFISVDCGTNSHDEIAAVRARGRQFIVCDHHAIGPQPAQPDALLNPQRTDCQYADKGLSAVGVALVVAQALRRELHRRGQTVALELKPMVELAALGTIADMAPMHGVNRALCWHGLRALGTSPRPGVQALAARETKVADVTADRVGFLLAPPINAAGRMNDPRTAFALLTTTSHDEARTLADQIDLENNRRKEAQAHVVDAALKLAQTLPGREHAVVVAQPDWHQGVVGIVASRVKDDFAVPAFVLAECEDGLARGSGRSIQGYDLVAGLHAVHQGALFTRFGGHAMAAGVTLPIAHVPEFRARLQAHVAETLPLGARDATWRVDAELTVPELTLELLALLDSLEPYGKGNEKPLFLLRDVELHRPTLVGKTGDWCKAALLEPGTQAAFARLRVDAFLAKSVLGTLRDRDRVDAVVRVERNAWRGQVSVQAKVQDLWASGTR